MAHTNRGDGNLTGRETRRDELHGSMSANQLLDSDHDRLLRLFEQFENLKSSARPMDKARLSRDLVHELKVHTQIEEEIWYPMLRENAGEQELVTAAEEDHAQAEQLIKDLEGSLTESKTFDDKMHELHQVVREHIIAEREELFAAADSAGVNTPEVAQRLHERKQELVMRLH